MFTVVTVFGHCPEIAKRWVQHHWDVFPPEQKVILVENLSYPDFEVTSWLLLGSRYHPNWVVLSTLRLIAPFEFCSHGKALDLALQYVDTKYVLTMDSDTFLHDYSYALHLLEIAEKENAAIVGFLHDQISLPYIYPFFALYETEFARQVGFVERYYGILPPEYLQFFKPAEGDIYREIRKTYLDVGQKIYFDAILQGKHTVPMELDWNKVNHLWTITPVAALFLGKGGREFYRAGRFGRKFHTV